MGCSASKGKHTTLVEQPSNSNHPANNAERNSVAANNVANHNPNYGQYDEQVDYDGLREPELEQIDNGLWRDTQNIVGVHNSRNMQDV